MEFDPKKPMGFSEFLMFARPPGAQQGRQQSTKNNIKIRSAKEENYTNMFMKYHGPKIGEIMEKLGQKEMLLELQDLDSQRSNIYKEFYSNI